MRLLRVLLFGLAIGIMPSTALAQYIYLDANGDRINDFQDRLSAIGPTLVSVFLDTSHDRNGSPQTCNSHRAPPGTGSGIDIFSYDFILSVPAGSGTVSWGVYSDSLGFAVSGNDQSNSTEFRASRIGNSALTGGLYKLGEILVTVLSGTPSMEIATGGQLDPAAFTGFGTHCIGSDYPNTYMLGLDWNDSNGLGAPPGGGGGSAPMIAAPPSASSREGSLLELTATATDPNP